MFLVESGRAAALFQVSQALPPSHPSEPSKAAAAPAGGLCTWVLFRCTIGWRYASVTQPFKPAGSSAGRWTECLMVIYVEIVSAVHSAGNKS